MLAFDETNEGCQAPKTSEEAMGTNAVSSTKRTWAVAAVKHVLTIVSTCSVAIAFVIWAIGDYSTPEAAGDFLAIVLTGFLLTQNVLLWAMRNDRQLSMRIGRAILFVALSAAGAVFLYLSRGVGADSLRLAIWLYFASLFFASVLDYLDHGLRLRMSGMRRRFLRA